jgi:uncharacterized tellurite resistance protein B-like protein
MAAILRWLGLDGEAGERSGEAETETVRRIAARLERLPRDQARRLAAFAYVLARVANADLHVDESEAREMERLVAEVAGLAPEEAALAVEIAKTQARLLGGTENYVVTREYRRLSTPEQRARLLDCLFAVAAADGGISSQESQEISSIAEELGFSPAETAAVRSRWRDHLVVLKKRS